MHPEGEPLSTGKTWGRQSRPGNWKQGHLNREFQGLRHLEQGLESGVATKGGHFLLTQRLYRASEQEPLSTGWALPLESWLPVESVFQSANLNKIELCFPPHTSQIPNYDGFLYREIHIFRSQIHLNCAPNSPATAAAQPFSSSFQPPQLVISNAPYPSPAALCPSACLQTFQTSYTVTLSPVMKSQHLDQGQMG